MLSKALSRVLFLSSLSFIFAPQVLAQELEIQQVGVPLFVYFEIIGTVVGIVLMFMLIRATRGIGGTVRTALMNLLVGVGFFTFAFAISAILDGFDIMNMQFSMELHMGLMLLAMIMIVLFATKLAKLLK